LTKVSIVASGEAMPWLARTPFRWNSGSCASLAPLQRLSEALIIQWTKEELPVLTTSVAQCVHVYNVLSFGAPDPELPHASDNATVHGVVFSNFSSTRYFRKQIGVATGAWDGGDTSMAVCVFPRLDHRFGVDGRVGLNFAVTILSLLFDFQTLRQGAAVRRR
jgi:hypothetical protein